VKLVVLHRVPYGHYNRRGLLEAAEKDGVETFFVAFLKQTGGVELTRSGQLIDRLPRSAGPRAIARRLRERVASGDTVIVNSAAYTNVRRVLAIRRQLPGALLLFYVNDWLLYDSRFPKSMAKRAVDALYRRVCDGILVLSRELLPHYPGAFHLDGASHLAPLTPNPVLPPRVAIVGSLDRRIDFGLLRDLAALLPDVEFHLHGWVHEQDPETARLTQQLCEGAENFRYHGAYRNEELAGILEGCSIGLVPYDTDYHVNRYVNPDKLYHYLRAGLEVVSTPIPQAVRMSAHVHHAPDAASFAACIRELLAGRNHKNLDPAAGGFGWQERWCDLDRIIRDVRTQRTGEHRGTG
jgi:hypothetical protein